MFSSRQLFLLAHLGTSVVFLHAFAGGVITLVRPTRTRLARLVQVGSTVSMAVMAWATVVSGTWLVYPGYRAKPPAGATLDGYPKEWLIHDASRAWWHTFAMEWKEHVGWLAPFLATAVAVVVITQRDLVRRDARVRRALGALFVVAFAATVVAAALGAAINKVAPNDFLQQ